VDTSEAHTTPLPTDLVLFDVFEPDILVWKHFSGENNFLGSIFAQMRPLRERAI